MRPIWNGTISFGLLAVPVRRFSGERRRQYLAAPMALDSALRLNLMRFPRERVPAEGFELPAKALSAYDISERELDMAAQRIHAMTTEWHPADYRDDFRNKWRSFIEQRIAARQGGQAPKTAPPPAPLNVVDFMALLKKSLEHKSPCGPRTQRSRPAAATKGS